MTSMVQKHMMKETWCPPNLWTEAPPSGGQSIRRELARN